MSNELFTHDWWKKHSLMRYQCKGYYYCIDNFKSKEFQRLERNTLTMCVEHYFHRSWTNRNHKVFYKSRVSRRCKYRFKNTAADKKRTYRIMHWEDKYYCWD